MSSVPLLPNELITLIFTHLYLSLGVHPAKEELDLPHLAPFVFAPFLRVSRTWHALALPFFVRFVGGGNPRYIAELVKKHKLEKAVDTVYLDPNIPLCEDDDDMDADKTDVSDDNDDSLGFGYETLSVQNYRRELKEEKRRWRPLLQAVMPHVRRLEVGRRLRQKDSIEWPGHPDDRYDFPAEDQESPGRALDTILGSTRSLPRSPALTHLRLNLPYGGILSTFHRLVANSPSLETLVIAAYTSDPADEEQYQDGCRFFTEPPKLPKLRSLTILNFRATHEYFVHSIGAPLISKNAERLEHLHLELYLDDETDRRRPFVSVSDAAFPRLQTFVLRSFHYIFAYDPALAKIPSLRRLDISFQPLTADFWSDFPPAWPETLTSLTLNGITLPSFSILATHILSSSSTLSLYRRIHSFTLDGDTSAPPGTIPVALPLADRLRAEGVVVSGSFAVGSPLELADDEAYEPNSASYAALEAARDSDSGETGQEDSGERKQVEGEADAEGDQGANDTSSDEDGEDEELDWDAEDSPQFRHLWSAAKREGYERSSLLAEFDVFRPRFQSKEAFEAAREKAVAAFQPFLQGRVPRRRGRASGL
ncbi:hypothetical protein JCM10213_004148 [Rhodosporidiobolus nylandii]